jgi:hypothetical protein
VLRDRFAVAIAPHFGCDLLHLLVAATDRNFDPWRLMAARRPPAWAAFERRLGDPFGEVQDSKTKEVFLNEYEIVPNTARLDAPNPSISGSFQWAQVTVNGGRKKTDSRREDAPSIPQRHAEHHQGRNASE